MLAAVERLDLDGDLARQGLLELVVIRESLADQPGLVRPDDRRVTVPHLDAHHLRKTPHQARQLLLPCPFVQRRTPRSGQDGIEAAKLDLTPGQGGGVLPLPFLHGAREQ